jgi:hypothetical protein
MVELLHLFAENGLIHRLGSSYACAGITIGRINAGHGNRYREVGQRPAHEAHATRKRPRPPQARRLHCEA